MSIHYLADPAATRRSGYRLGQRLFPGAVIALVGQLGAGKTCLCQGIAEGAGVPDCRVVTSPTFVLVQEYEGGRLPIFHFDTYRLRSEAEFAEVEAGEYFSGSGACIVEWADRVPGCLPNDYLRVELIVTGPTKRLMQLDATGSRHAELLRDWVKSLEI
jgi:tRNA threonylcarbamoyladenosine biosynthesis protein TsaE